MLLPCSVNEYKSIKSTGNTSIITAHAIYGTAKCANFFI